MSLLLPNPPESLDETIAKLEALRSMCGELARHVSTNRIWAQGEAREVANRLARYSPRCAQNIAIAADYTVCEPELLAWYARAAAFELGNTIVELQKPEERMAFDAEMTAIGIKEPQ